MSQDIRVKLICLYLETQSRLMKRRFIKELIWEVSTQEMMAGTEIEAIHCLDQWEEVIWIHYSHRLLHRLRRLNMYPTERIKNTKLAKQIKLMNSTASLKDQFQQHQVYWINHRLQGSQEANREEETRRNKFHQPCQSITKKLKEISQQVNIPNHTMAWS